MARNTKIDWPPLPEVHEPSPPERRRAWGKVSHEERYRRQRTDLLRAAARLASRRGHAGTRVSDVVAEAGLSKSTFYEHFSSKEDCFVELHHRVSAAMLRAGIEAAEAADDLSPVESILAVIRALVGYVERDPRLAQTLRSDLGAAGPAIQEQRADNVRRITQLFEALGRRLGATISDEDLHMTARVFVHGVIEIFPDLERDQETLDLQLERLARVACRSLELDDG